MTGVEHGSVRRPDDLATDIESISRSQIAIRLAEVEERIADLERAHRAAIAEVEYAKRRAASDVQHAHRFAIEELARRLLPFKDSLETAVAIETDDVQALRSGLELSLKLLQSALEKKR